MFSAQRSAFDAVAPVMFVRGTMYPYYNCILTI